jgi:hypothetical protein
MDELLNIIIPKIINRVKENLPIYYKLDLSKGSRAYDFIETTVLSALQEDRFVDFIYDRFEERLKMEMDMI